LATVEDRVVYTGDEAGFACGAIDATSAACIRNSKRHMVEYVEGLELELSFDPLSYVKVLE
jgi:hypothetical protein